MFETPTAGEAWGPEHDISVEEPGQRIRFTDFYEEIVGTHFVITPRLTNSKEDLKESDRTTQFTPYEHVQFPSSYIRNLLSARLDRVEQISGQNPVTALKALWELCVELHEAPNEYPWEVI